MTRTCSDTVKIVAQNPDTMPGTVPDVNYVKDFGVLQSVDPDYVMACVNYSTELPIHDDKLLVVNAGLPQLEQEHKLELWTSSQKVKSGTHGNINYRYNSGFLFGCWKSISGENIRNESAQAYSEILAFLDSTVHANLLRVWNYMSDINKEQDGLERYRGFCLGRHESLLETGSISESVLPAASALGSECGNLVVYFVSTVKPGHAIENPRQVSAYYYPEQYGPRSPSFSRAMQYGSNANTSLFISGTASIQGHETMHAGDLEKQFNETVNNINTLIAESDCHCRSIADLGLLKIYVRFTEHYEAVRSLVQNVAPDVPTMYLKADICRPDLLLEIEGLSLS